MAGPVPNAGSAELVTDFDLYSLKADSSMADWSRLRRDMATLPWDLPGKVTSRSR